MPRERRVAAEVSHPLNVRLTSAEKVELERAAYREGFPSLSSFVRTVLVEHVDHPPRKKLRSWL